MHRDHKGGGAFPEVDVQTVFIWFLIFDRFDRGELLDQLFDVFLKILKIRGLTDPEIAEGVSPLCLRLTEASHGTEETRYFLNVVANVVGFGSDLHHYIEHLRIGLFKPGMPRMKLVSQDQSQFPIGRIRHGSVPLFRLHTPRGHLQRRPEPRAWQGRHRRGARIPFPLAPFGSWG